MPARSFAIPINLLYVNSYADMMRAKNSLPVVLLALILLINIAHSAGMGQIQLVEYGGNNPYYLATLQGSNSTISFLVIANGTRGVSEPYITDSSALASNGISVQFNPYSGTPPFAGGATIVVAQRTPIGYYNITFGLNGADPSYSNTTTMQLFVGNVAILGPVNADNNTYLTSTTIPPINSTNTTVQTTVLITTNTTVYTTALYSTTIPQKNSIGNQNNLIIFAIIIIVIIAALVIYYLKNRKGRKPARKK